ncbi:hypothetical protein BT63DRAFT_6662 [Microthyrium microscopicum]|uniref:Uncharacterized protein n=1 Tax=Microthyrium microscopicum TaxID=703497 RepID=A0A6A6US47_9PEZI|nr:hypothetical protein BT63DRAFT_6662 [Microthyrium microscopicum]
MSLVQTQGEQLIVTGVIPNTQNNMAAFSALDTATVLEGTAAMTTVYPDSTIDHFDLYSFYYACSSATQTSLLGLPLSCTITASAYTDVSKPVFIIIAAVPSRSMSLFASIPIWRNAVEWYLSK